MQSKNKIIVVDDDPAILEMISDGLMINGFDVITAKNPAETLHKIENIEINFALLDLDLGWPEMNGVELGHELKTIFSDLIVFIMTGFHNFNFAVDASKKFAYSYVIKPFRIDQLLSLFEQAQREYELVRENRKLRKIVKELKNKNENFNTAKNVKVKNMDSNKINSGKLKYVEHSNAVKTYKKHQEKDFNPDNKS